MVDLPDNADPSITEMPAPEVASMYGLTPKVEAAIRDCFTSQQWHRLRMLMDPLHPADKADLLERISSDEIQILVSQYGSEFDPEILPYLDEEVREDVVEMLDPEVFAASLPELDSDDVVTIAEELEPEELDDALAASRIENANAAPSALPTHSGSPFTSCPPARAATAIARKYGHVGGG